MIGWFLLVPSEPESGAQRWGSVQENIHGVVSLQSQTWSQEIRLLTNTHGLHCISPVTFDRFVFILMEWIFKMPVTKKETSLLTFWQNFIIYFLKARAFNTNMRDLKHLCNLTQQSVHSHLKSAIFQILPISSISARMASLSLSDRLSHIWEQKPSSVACVEDKAKSWIYFPRHWWPSPLSPQSGGPCTPSLVLCILGAWQRDLPTTWPKAHCLHSFLPGPLVGLSALTITAKLFHLCFCLSSFLEPLPSCKLLQNLSRDSPIYLCSHC